jgi:hypothetical protein
MSKPSPFFKNEKEKQELIQLRDSFQFSDPEETSKLIVLIAGREGSGKTHLACTMSQLEPVYLIDTEYRAQIVTRKFKDVKFATAKNFLEMVAAVKHILKHQPPGTIIIDSGSDLQIFAEIEYLERSEKERVGLPYNWSEVWRLCNAIIDDIKFSRRFNLVLTARVKEEYLNEKPTGQVIPRIYSALPYKADVTLQFTSDKERKLLVTKNGFTGDISVSISRTEGLPSIVEKLQRGTSTVADATGKELRKAS